MCNSRPENIIRNNSGETLVEVMVAFIVLMIVLAMFSGSIDSCSSAITYSIDIRRTSDNEYKDFHSYMIEEKLAEDKHTAELWNRVSQTDSKIETILADPGNPGTSDVITFTAKKYESGDTVYWVFK